LRISFFVFNTVFMSSPQITLISYNISYQIGSILFFSAIPLRPES